LEYWSNGVLEGCNAVGIKPTLPARHRERSGEAGGRRGGFTPPSWMTPTLPVNGTNRLLPKACNCNEV